MLLYIIYQNHIFYYILYYQLSIIIVTTSYMLQLLQFNGGKLLQ